MKNRIAKKQIKNFNKQLIARMKNKKQSRLGKMPFDFLRGTLYLVLLTITVCAKDKENYKLMMHIIHHFIKGNEKRLSYWNNKLNLGTFKIPDENSMIELKSKVF